MEYGTLIVFLMVFFNLKHFAFDFVYQPKWMWANKETYGHPGGIVHALIHAASSACLLIIWPYMWFLIIIEFITHYHIDWLKMNINKWYNLHPQTPGFWRTLGADQSMHQLVYLFMAWGIAL
jgi:hypothetical protein